MLLYKKLLLMTFGPTLVILVKLVRILLSVNFLSTDDFPRRKNCNALPASVRITCALTEYMQSRYVYGNFADTL